jgi:chromate transporter
MHGDFHSTIFCVASPTPLYRIFLIWLSIGIQSFGGGSATFFLIHQACQKYGWITEEEFLNAWALAQLTPGINLVKLTIFIGFRLRRWPGVLMAMTGLLLPSSLVTILMTSGFTIIKDIPSIKAVMRGVLPATIGLALAMSTQFTSPVLKLAFREGKIRFVLHVLILVVSASAMASERLSPALILLLTALITTIVLLFSPIKPPKEDFAA